MSRSWHEGLRLNSFERVGSRALGWSFVFGRHVSEFYSATQKTGDMILVVRFGFIAFEFGIRGVPLQAARLNGWEGPYE